MIEGMTLLCNSLSRLWILIIFLLIILFFENWHLIGNPRQIHYSLKERHFIYVLKYEKKRETEKHNQSETLTPLHLKPTISVQQKQMEEKDQKQAITTQPMEFQTTNKTTIVNTRKSTRKHKKGDSEQRTFIKNNDNSIQEMNYGYKERINSIIYDPIEYDTVPIQTVHYDENGRIDTKKNRIDFKQSNWYAQFQYYRELLSQQPSLNETALDSSLHISSGKTNAILTPNYAILSNTCINPSNYGIQVFGEEGKTLQHQVSSKYNINDFYFNTAVPVEGTCFTEDYHKERNHTAIFRPRSYSNIYHFLEGSSQMIRLALHPQDFPSISHIIMASQKSPTFQKWHGFLEFVYLDLFSSSKRPIIHFTSSDSVFQSRKRFCDSFLVVFRNWDSDGAGLFIPDYLGVDMLRAAAYRHAGVLIDLEGKEKLNYIQISRVNKRRLLNEKEVYQAVMKEYENQLDCHFTVLEQESAAMQVQRFAQVDILVAVHGAGLTNMIFMVPQSYLIELMPPSWDLACYRRLAENADIGYRMLREANTGQVNCKKGSGFQKCRQREIRDRDFNVTVSKVLENVERGILYVRKNKYVGKRV